MPMRRFRACITGSSDMRNPTLRPKQQTSLLDPYRYRLAVYEKAKKAWDEAHPEARYQERDKALRAIAKEFGI